MMMMMKVVVFFKSLGRFYLDDLWRVGFVGFDVDLQAHWGGGGGQRRGGFFFFFF